MNRFEYRCTFACRSRRKQAHRTTDARTFIGQDVAESIFSYHDVEESRLLNHTHGSIVYKHIVGSHFRILRCHFLGNLTPQTRRCQYVGLINYGEVFANAALNFLERGWNGENFHEVTENLRSSDPYMVMADFKDYRRAQADLQRLYADREQWAKMSLKNIANSGIFSADRAVLDYARDIWHASAVK